MKRLFTKFKTIKYLGMLTGVLIMQQVYAADYVVTNTNDIGAGSFRQALEDAANNAANGPHTISFTIPAGSIIDVSSKWVGNTGFSMGLRARADITVNAPSGGIILNANVAPMQIFYIDAGRNVVFNNLIIQNANPGGSWGAGIDNRGNLTLNNCTVKNCTTTGSGKAISVEGAGTVLTLNNSLIKDNTGAGGTGAINLRSGARVVVTNSIIEGNTAGQGGAIYFDSGAGVVNSISNSIIRNNSSTAEKGGGISLNNGTLNINNSEISGNTATGTNRGGGIGLNGSATAVLTLTNSTISGNTAANGGGIYIYSPAVYTITNTTFSGNTATVDGGGMGTNSFGTLNNCTFTLNNCTATTSGAAGGFVTYGNNPSFNYCLLVGNTTSDATNAVRSANGNGTVTSTFGGNVVGGSTSFMSLTGTTTGSVKTDAAVNTILSATLADNGGATLPGGGAIKTHALVSGSPAINIAGAAYTLALDQRGYTRDANEDAGAYEFNAVLPVELIGFNAQIDVNKAKLSWSTASEINNDYFVVERSIDGINYSLVAKVQSKGNGASYVVYDNTPATGVNYYRLSQFDIDGKTEVLDIKSLKFGLATTSSLTIYPNPATDKIFVNLDNYTNAVSITLLDQSGRRVYSEKVSGGLSNYQLKINQKLASGIYLLSLKGEGLNEVKKVIIQ